MGINVIFSMTNKGAIGNNNELLIKNKYDMKWFKYITDNSICIMGRKTYDSIKAVAKNKDDILPGRICIVVSGTEFANYSELPYVVNNIDDAIDLAYSLKKKHNIQNNDSLKMKSDINIIGGASIINAALSEYNDKIDKVYVTHFDSDEDGDAKIDEQLISTYMGKTYKAIIFMFPDGSGKVAMYTDEQL